MSGAQPPDRRRTTTTTVVVIVVVVSLLRHYADDECRRSAAEIDDATNTHRVHRRISEKNPRHFNSVVVKTS